MRSIKAEKSKLTWTEEAEFIEEARDLVLPVGVGWLVGVSYQKAFISLPLGSFFLLP